MSLKGVGIATAAGTGGTVSVIAVLAYLDKLTTEYGLALGLAIIAAGAMAFALAMQAVEARKARIAYSKELKEARAICDQKFMDIMERQDRRAEQTNTTIDNNTRALTALVTHIKG